ncbi:hypothetical protein JM93_02813 [Roseibium hamelinense]|uniref:DUF1285 domain-containing protein n=1 Tax=Roseibium hamelinense TaxID=150831 RepID=A0A562SXM2_9HYPH|nr:DUF1285 domain-containing protein [Roseibium hamelinense]TWI86105.1 hypothetical protein JM93_02813 [Roseibium hamelinense]
MTNNHKPANRENNPTDSGAETLEQLKGLPSGLTALIERAGSNPRAAPPVELWNPPFCGDLDIRIASDGTWSYLGSAIQRDALVRLFASVLRKDEDGKTYLVTPVEKIGITVEDAPFLGVEMHKDGGGANQMLVLRTNVGDVVEIGGDHPLRFVEDPKNGGLKPYVLVRGRLEALLSRPLLYELAELFETADVGGTDKTGVWSGGEFFAAPGTPE